MPNVGPYPSDHSKLSRRLPRGRPILVLQIRQSEGNSGRDVCLRADGSRSSAVGLEHVAGDPPHAIDVPLAPGRIDTDDEAALTEPLRFVDSAGIRDQVAERGG